jgi:hypothetical protein
MREVGRQLRRLGLAAALLLAAAAPGWGQTAPTCATYAALDDGWTIASPERVGRAFIDSKNDEPHLSNGSAPEPHRGSGALDMLTNFILPSVRDNNTR